MEDEEKEAQDQWERPRPACRIEVRDSIRADTIPRLIAGELPTLEGDSLLIGHAVDDSTGSGVLFVYHTESRRIATQEYQASVHETSLSPDNKYFAYFKIGDDQRTFGLIREAPNGPVIAQTVSVAIAGTDMTVAASRWYTMDSVELFLQPDSLQHERWVRFRTGIPHREWRVDTVTIR